MQLERVERSSLTGVPLTRQILIRFRTRALRKRVWYRTLSTIERGLIDLTIQWVDNIQSKPMTRIVMRILRKLAQSMEVGIVQVIGRGRELASRITELATKWGNSSALEWKSQQGFLLALGRGIVLR